MNTEVKSSEPEFQLTVECISNGSPHHLEATKILQSIDEIPTNSKSFFLRTYFTWELFHRSEELLSRDYFEIREYSELLLELSEAISRSTKALEYFSNKINYDQLNRENADNVFSITQNHYGNLFKDFSDQHYFNEAKELLSSRLVRNNLLEDFSSFKNALDAGCGGGRYTFALQSLGVKNVTGIDFSKINIETASRHVNQFNSIKNINFQEMNILKTTFDNETFDFVFSNGVLHHSESIYGGLEEIHRLLKVGGKAFLYIIESPGGIHWDTIEICRNLMFPVSGQYARNLFSLLGVPTNRIFYILDHIMVPINTRLTTNEIENMFIKIGFSNFYRFKRGADIDRIEKVVAAKSAGNLVDLEWKLGVGEHRYMLTK